MLRRVKSIIVVIPLLLAFSPVKNNSVTEYYYNLRFLKQSDEPKEMTIIRIDNVGRQKSILERGILITYKNRNARDVRIASDSTQWKPTRMQRGKHGVWYYFMTESTSMRIRYKFLVDGIWIADPKNPDREDDLSGSYLSLITPGAGIEHRTASYRFINSRTVEFRVYRPSAQFVSLVGDFNGWNPENDILRKDDSGFWRLQKRLPRGLYRYKYIIDGEWVPDLYNARSASDNMNGVCSLIEIK